ncbi:MAG: UDP-N-acetyl-D-mannosamine dehydrogenase, partial [Alphaproteobacteria bacterium]
RLGLDVWKVIQLANHHPRVNILTPGPGVGGHCIAVDPWFIINSAPDLTPLMQAVRGVNDGKPHHVVEKVKAAAGRGAKVACLGLAYKPDVDDLRESPSITVVEELVKAGYDVRVVEPHLKQWNNMILHGLEDAVNASELVVTLTGHSVFKTLDRGLLEGKILIDTVGLYR